MWDELREKAFGNQVLGSLDAVVDQAASGLQVLESTPELLRSPTAYPWI